MDSIATAMPRRGAIASTSETHASYHLFLLAHAQCRKDACTHLLHSLLAGNIAHMQSHAYMCSNEDMRRDHHLRHPVPNEKVCGHRSTQASNHVGVNMCAKRSTQPPSASDSLSALTGTPASRMHSCICRFVCMHSNIPMCSHAQKYARTHTIGTRNHTARTRLPC